MPTRTTRASSSRSSPAPSTPQRTLFYEIIERIGADTFGGGNVRALYEAVQAEKAEHEGNTPAENAQ